LYIWNGVWQLRAIRRRIRGLKFYHALNPFLNKIIKI